MWTTGGWVGKWGWLEEVYTFGGNYADSLIYVINSVYSRTEKLKTVLNI
jgi:hypothetical protein